MRLVKKINQSYVFELQNKFKKEERQNSWRIDKAFSKNIKSTFNVLSVRTENQHKIEKPDCFLTLSAGERRKLDIEYFSKLLEMILEVQKNRKKHKSLAEKNEPKKKRRKAKGICEFFLLCITVN